MLAYLLFVPVQGNGRWPVPCLTCSPAVPPQRGQVTGDAAAAAVAVVVAVAAVAAAVVEPCFQMYVSMQNLPWY